MKLSLSLFLILIVDLRKSLVTGHNSLVLCARPSEVLEKLSRGFLTRETNNLQSRLILMKTAGRRKNSLILLSGGAGLLQSVRLGQAKAKGL